MQVFAFILLASLVSLPIFLAVDAYKVISEPTLVKEFAKYGLDGITPDLYMSQVPRFIDSLYSYVVMTWQGIVSLIGLTSSTEINGTPIFLVPSLAILSTQQRSR